MSISTVVQPIEIDGKHFIDVTIDGCALERKGPFSADEAEIVARRVCHTLFHQPAHIGGMVVRRQGVKEEIRRWAKL